MWLASITPKKYKQVSVWLVGWPAGVRFFFGGAADWPDASTLYPVAYPEVACAESYTVVVMAHSYSA